MSVFLQIDPNPNCDAMDGMVFRPRTASRAVSQLRFERHGEAVWCDVTGVDDGARWVAATACLIDDSGDGACYLVYGGSWGLRLREAASRADWDVSAPGQWGASYLLLAGDGSDLRFV